MFVVSRYANVQDVLLVHGVLPLHGRKQRETGQLSLAKRPNSLVQLFHAGETEVRRSGLESSKLIGQDLDALAGAIPLPGRPRKRHHRRLRQHYPR